MSVRPSILFVIDVNVLIDYWVVDTSKLKLMTTHLGPIHVPRRVLDEITDPVLNVAACENLGLIVVLEEIEELEAAISLSAKGLSVPDKVALIMAQRRAWIPVTNDIRLRTAMIEEGLSPKWGLDMLIELVRGGHLKLDAAITTAQSIIHVNPRMRDPKLIKRFVQSANEQR